ncbi:MAG: hypothetical protein HYR88_01640 [Verrucomicrobia bacterium]|nr:hypothetical protein [Verrucomicrobiota bacterium]
MRIATVLCFLNPICHALPGAPAPDTRAEAPSADADSKSTVILVVGAPGEEAFQEKFAAWADRWKETTTKGDAKLITIGRDAATATNSLAQFKAALEAEPRDGFSDLWLVLIGHGTFDGKEAKFNLKGSDLSASELSTLLQPFHRRLAIINCASASAPFINALSATNRVIITATKSGSEQNFARYGDHLSAALGDPEADIDKDGQVSLLEAHLTAAKRTLDAYQNDGRLPTEHSLIDDNGDKLGTPSDWFRGIRASKKAKDGAEPDGLRAHQLCLVPNEADRRMPQELRQRRDELELEIARLRELKASMPEDDYYAQLETILLRLGALYQKADPKTAAPPTPSAKP